MAQKIEDVYHVSSFPPILDCYMSAQCPEKRSHNRKEQVVQSTSDAVDPDQVMESKRKALLDQRHLETYYRLLRLKDELSHQYATLLKEKIQRQRQEMKTCDVSKTTQGHKEQKRRTTQQLTRSVLTHDDAFMKSLPKTRHYLVLELQKQLTRLGCLQSRREQEVFRVWLEQHRSIYHLEKQLQAMEVSSTSKPDVTLKDLLKHKTRRTLPKLQISPEETAAKQDDMPVSVRGGANACQLQGKQTRGQDETELMFPKVFTREFKVPKFSALQATFLETLSTNMLLQKNYEPPIRSRRTDVTRHKLRLMHNVSRSHMTETQRIMAKNGFSLQFTDGFSIKELMEYECPHKIQIQKSKSAADFTHLSLNDETTTESPEPLTEKSNTPISLQFAEIRPKDSSISLAEDTHSSDVPLCIHDLYASLAIEMESSEEKMWTNYT